MFSNLKFPSISYFNSSQGKKLPPAFLNFHEIFQIVNHVRDIACFLVIRNPDFLLDLRLYMSEEGDVNLDLQGIEHGFQYLVPCDFLIKPEAEQVNKNEEQDEQEEDEKIAILRLWASEIFSLSDKNEIKNFLSFYRVLDKFSMFSRSFQTWINDHQKNLDFFDDHPWLHALESVFQAIKLLAARMMFMCCFLLFQNKIKVFEEDSRKKWHPQLNISLKVEECAETKTSLLLQDEEALQLNIAKIESLLEMAKSDLKSLFEPDSDFRREYFQDARGEDLDARLRDCLLGLEQLADRVKSIEEEKAGLDENAGSPLRNAEELRERNQELFQAFMADISNLQVEMDELIREKAGDIQLFIANSEKEKATLEEKYAEVVFKKESFLFREKQQKENDEIREKAKIIWRVLYPKMLDFLMSMIKNYGEDVLIPSSIFSCPWRQVDLVGLLKDDFRSKALSLMDDVFKECLPVELQNIEVSSDNIKFSCFSEKHLLPLRFDLRSSLQGASPYDVESYVKERELAFYNRIDKLVDHGDLPSLKQLKQVAIYFFQGEEKKKQKNGIFSLKFSSEETTQEENNEKEFSSMLNIGDRIALYYLIYKTDDEGTTVANILREFFDFNWGVDDKTIKPWLIFSLQELYLKLAAKNFFSSRQLVFMSKDNWLITMLNIHKVVFEECVIHQHHDRKMVYEMLNIVKKMCENITLLANVFDEFFVDIDHIDFMRIRDRLSEGEKVKLLFSMMIDFLSYVFNSLKFHNVVEYLEDIRSLQFLPSFVDMQLTSSESILIDLAALFLRKYKDIFIEEISFFEFTQHQDTNKSKKKLPKEKVNKNSRSEHVSLTIINNKIKLFFPETNDFFHKALCSDELFKVWEHAHTSWSLYPLAQSTLTEHLLQACRDGRELVSHEDDVAYEAYNFEQMSEVVDISGLTSVLEDAEKICEIAGYFCFPHLPLLEASEIFPSGREFGKLLKTLKKYSGNYSLDSGGNLEAHCLFIVSILDSLSSDTKNHETMISLRQVNQLFQEKFIASVRVLNKKTILFIFAYLASQRIILQEASLVKEINALKESGKQASRSSSFIQTNDQQAIWAKLKELWDKYSSEIKHDLEKYAMPISLGSLSSSLPLLTSTWILSCLRDDQVLLKSSMELVGGWILAQPRQIFLKLFSDKKKGELFFKMHLSDESFYDYVMSAEDVFLESLRVGVRNLRHPSSILDEHAIYLKNRAMVSDCLDETKQISIFLDLLSPKDHYNYMPAKIVNSPLECFGFFMTLYLDLISRGMRSKKLVSLIENYFKNNGLSLSQAASLYNAYINPYQQISTQQLADMSADAKLALCYLKLALTLAVVRLERANLLSVSQLSLASYSNKFLFCLYLPVIVKNLNFFNKGSQEEERMQKIFRPFQSVGELKRKLANMVVNTSFDDFSSKALVDQFNTLKSYQRGTVFLSALLQIYQDIVDGIVAFAHKNKLKKYENSFLKLSEFLAQMKNFYFIKKDKAYEHILQQVGERYLLLELFPQHSKIDFSDRDFLKNQYPGIEISDENGLSASDIPSGPTVSKVLEATIMYTTANAVFFGPSGKEETKIIPWQVNALFDSLEFSDDDSVFYYTTMS